MRQLVIQPQAEVDIVEAVAWYEVQRSGLGFELIDELDSIIGRVVRHPLQFPQVKPDVRRALLSKFPYSVYFRVTDQRLRSLPYSTNVVTQGLGSKEP